MNAEEWLGSLDPIGWRFGLERIRALMEALGDPQLRFESVHVVGTNGKSSVTTMTAALLEASGRSSGAYLSPHQDRWAQRVEIGGNPISVETFDRATSQVAEVVPQVERALGERERITQFEAATAAAFVALADAEVEVGVIEAGLGGRLDATNVLDSRVTVLTSIGLDHTAWLGDTELEIAAEKLAVLRPDTVLVTGRLSPDVREFALAEAKRTGSVLIETAEELDGLEHLAPYLRRNLSVAIEVATVVADLAPDAVAAALEAVELEGRFQAEDGDPPLIRDAAHNPDGAVALAEALGSKFPVTHVVACMAILADKDASGIVAALAPALSAAVCTEIPADRLAGAGRPGTSSVPASELVRLFEAAGVPATANADPTHAVGLARALARERGGVALIAGSHYLLGY